MAHLARQTKRAARALASLSARQRDDCLRAMAAGIDENKKKIGAENAKDLRAGEEAGLSSALMDRLELTDKRISAMSNALREVADLPNPLGRVLDDRKMPNGLCLKKVSTPIGVIVILYESRPNVTADAAGLCVKSGNATILRGGKEAICSNQIIAKTMISAAVQTCPDFPKEAIAVVETTDRQAIPALLSHNESIDLCMPRGGEGLIRAVTECSRVPVIKHFKGVCHVYLDKDADLRQAADITLNAKTQRAGVCNAIETLLIHEKLSDDFILDLSHRLLEKGVELRGDAEFLDRINGKINPSEMKIVRASEDDWGAEYLDLVLAVKLVKSVSEAINHINEYGSGHSDCIVTKDAKTAEAFMNAVDAAAVYWNASTRFTDGGEFGMGAEIGISTDKIGARGPMGLEELTSYKWLGFGKGQIRK